MRTAQKSVSAATPRRLAAFRRSYSTRRAAVALATVLSACQAQPPAQTGATPQTSAPTERAGAGQPLPMDQQVLSVGYSADTYSTGPDSRPDVGKWPLNARIFDTLVNMDEQLQVEPMLALRWEHDVESNTYRFFLREGVTFHDGGELTAEDVKFTLDLLADINPRNYQELTPDGIRVVDRYTVEITPQETNNRLVEQLAHPSFGIHRAGSVPGDPVGTGPFRFVEYAKDQQLVVERYDDHWSEEAHAQVQRITYRFLPDPQSRMLGLRSGDLHIIADVPPDATSEFEGSPGLKLVRSGPAAFGRVDMNIAGQPPYDELADETVRRAVAHAVDREGLIRAVYGENADTEPLPGHLFGEFADAVQGVPHDPERAQSLLDEAGWAVEGGQRVKDGTSLRLTYLPLSPTPPARRIGEVLQLQLRQVGIDVEIDPGADAAVTSARREAGEYDMLHQGGSQNDANPCFLLDLLYRSPERGGRESNAFLAAGGAVDDAIDACREAPTLDEARRHAAEAARLLIEEEYIYIPVGNEFRIWAMHDSVQGFIAHPGLGRANFEEIFLGQ